MTKDDVVTAKEGGDVLGLNGAASLVEYWSKEAQNYSRWRGCHPGRAWS